MLNSLDKRQQQQTKKAYIYYHWEALKAISWVILMHPKKVIVTILLSGWLMQTEVYTHI